MDRYYVNNTPQPNGDYEVHKEDCYWLGLANSKKDLGFHSYCYSAVAKAKQSYPRANGCKTCANECHTS